MTRLGTFMLIFPQAISEQGVTQPIVACSRCLSLVPPTRKAMRGSRATLYYEHEHRPSAILLTQLKDGRRLYSTEYKRRLGDVLDFAGMGWRELGWTILQVASYIDICLKERRKGRKIDALAVLLADLAEPPEAEKAEILRAIGLEGGAAADG